MMTATRYVPAHSAFEGILGKIRSEPGTVAVGFTEAGEGRGEYYGAEPAEQQKDRP